MPGLLAHRDARVFLAAQGLSQFGDSAMLLVMGVWTKDLTDSNTAAGLVYFLLALPALAAPLGGLLVDRVRRRNLLVVVNVLTGLLVSTLLLIHSDRGLWLIYLVALGYGASRSVLNAAQSALLAEMLPKDLLGSANAALQTLTQALRLLAPLVGAGLFAASGASVVVVIDVVTFAAAALAVTALRFREARPERAGGERGERWWQQVTGGFVHLRRSRVLWDVVVCSAVSMLVLGFAETVVFAVIEVGLGRPPAFLGVLSTVQGAGAVLGGLTAAQLVRRVGAVTALAVGLAGFALGDLLFVVPSLPVVVVGFVLAGVANSWLVVSAVTAIQRGTPRELQGRVYACADMLISVPQTLSIGLGAGLVAVADYRVLLVAMAVVTVVSSARLAVRHGLGRREDDPAPADTPAGSPTADDPAVSDPVPEPGT